MSNNYLVNNDYNYGGIYRALLLDINNELKVYIPCIHNGKIGVTSNNDDDGYVVNITDYQKYHKLYPIAQWCVPNLESKQHDAVHPCWVTFESGDVKRPIVMGWMGKGIKYSAASSSSDSPNGDNQQDTGDNITYVGDIAKLLEVAESKIGCDYVYGAVRSSNADTNTFDCSSYIYWCYAQIGITLGTSTESQVNNGTSVSSLNDIQPGDLILWSGSDTNGNPAHEKSAHVVMVFDKNTIIHCGAPDSGGSSCVNKRDISFAKNKYNDRPHQWIRRIISNADVGNNVSGDKSGLLNLLNQYINNITSKSGYTRIVSYYFKNLKTGEIINSNSNQKLFAASLIKLFVMVKTYDCINNGTFTLDSVSNSLNNMITVSDNNATNELVKKIGNGDFNSGANSVNNYAKSLGCHNTTLRNPLGSTNVPRSNFNQTCTKDCATILEKIYTGELPYSKEMLNLLLNQTRTNKIPAGLSGTGAKVANKTGETDEADNDAAIVFPTNGNDYVLVIMIQDMATAYNNGMGQIPKISKAFYNYINGA